MDHNSNDEHENHEGQSTMHVLTFSFTTFRTPPPPYLKNKSNIVELLYEKLLAVRAPPTPSGDYSRSQSFQLQDFRAEMYLPGPNQWKQLPEKRKR